jgi:hydroxymethylglutaryl-CoA reductase
MSVFSAIDESLSESSKVRARQAILAKNLSSPFFTPLLFDPEIVGKKNCENLVGQVALPVGIAGPVGYPHHDSPLTS